MNTRSNIISRRSNKTARLPALAVGIALAQGAASGVALADGVAADAALVARVVPAAAASLVCERIAAANGKDVFEIESRDGKIVLRGNNGVAVASALKRYLADYCHADPAWHCGGQMKLPQPLPMVPDKIRVASPHAFRFNYNYCTHGYTMAWWDWPQWERELDNLALHVVNLALIIEGQEQVWINALKEMGYSETEVRKWLCLPSHQPWQYMSNMEDYGGPIPASIVRRRLDLGRKIITRMRELGMEPVQQGYYGIVPSDFHRRFPDARIHPQGNWGGHLKRPDMLDPADPAFAKLATAFYREQKHLFGDAKFLAADPFHEGGTTAGIDLADCARRMYAPMAAAYPNVTWVLQSWQANPRQQMLDALDKTHCLVLDLFCEAHENWRVRNEFGGTPWLWCIVHNFGGNDGLNSRLDWVGTGVTKALHDPAQHRMSGIGGLMEGSDTIPAIWDRFFDNSWAESATPLPRWLHDYTRRRYGTDSTAANQAWAILADTCYNSPGDHGEFPINSVVCARPSLNPDQRANPYTGTKQPYDTTRLVDAWKLMLDAAPACAASDGYRYDLADVTRQVLADLATRYHAAIVRAFTTHNAAKVRQVGDRMLALIADMDRLAGTRREFMLGPWLADARAWGDTPEEKNLCEWNARTLLTTWTVPESHIDYANREWHGLLGNFYLNRWRMWLDALNAAAGQNTNFDQTAVRKKIQDWEYRWTHETDTFSTTPTGDTVAISKELLARYGADAADPELDAEPHLRDAKAADFIGRWRYQAEGSTWEREFTAEGVALLYQNGKIHDWKNFTWTFDHGAVVLKRADGSVFERHLLRDRDTLLFTMSPWEPAKRVPKEP